MKKKWGKWELSQYWNGKEYEEQIVFEPRKYSYDIAISRMETLEKQLHWIAQLGSKTWTTNQDLLDLSSFMRDKFGSTTPGIVLANHVRIDYRNLPKVCEELGIPDQTFMGL